MDNIIFKSKRNKVTLAEFDGAPCVKKEFLNLTDLQNETMVYESLKASQVKTPLLLKVCEEAIYLSYVGGKTALEILEEQEATNQINYDIWDCFMETLLEFYRSMALVTRETTCMSDLNLRNFIYNAEEKCIFILDFEFCKSGEYEEDLGNLLAFLCTYYPCYTQTKLHVADYIQKMMQAALNLDSTKVERYRVQETALLLKRRRLKGK